jgi:hypothetical protein
MSIKIIGAGFPRTGTTTLKEALEILGYSKTYHFKDLMMMPHRVRYWKELEEKGATDFDALFEGYQATVDFPGYPYYKILMERYPDAKVILTHRDIEAWHASTTRTIRPVGAHTINDRPELAALLETNERLRNSRDCFEFFSKTYIQKQFAGNFDDFEAAKSVFLNHMEEVKAAVPRDQLLVYDVREGWEPLCNFLEVEVPNVDLPHANKGDNFHMLLEKMIEMAARG